VLVRPSYVLSGAAMSVAYNDDALRIVLSNAADVSQVSARQVIGDRRGVEPSRVGPCHDSYWYMALCAHRALQRRRRVPGACVKSGDSDPRGSVRVVTSKEGWGGMAESCIVVLVPSPGQVPPSAT
jgi:hypothetical protein